MIVAIALNTVRECMRRSFPYISVAAIVMMSLASRLLHLFAFDEGTQETISLAISGVLLSGLVTAAFVGTALVRTDLERGTLALMLSQPVGLGSYVVGRFLGLAAATSLVCALAAGGIAIALLATGSPQGVLGAPLLLGWLRAALAVALLSAAALAVSAAASRLFAPVILLALFVAGDIAGSGPLARLLPAFGIFGLDARRPPPLPWLSLYAALHSVVFLVLTYLQLALKPRIRSEN